MQEETRKKVKKQTPCRFYQRGRCTNKDCEFLHEGPPPLCYNLLKNGHCDTGDGFGADERVEGCIYSHDTKKVGCMFFHITHNCSRGEDCRFSHDPLSESELANLRRIYEEVELDKKSVDCEWGMQCRRCRRSWRRRCWRTVKRRRRSRLRMFPVS